MNAAVLAGLGILCFALGYIFYSRLIARKIYILSSTFVTPAHEMEDGVDYVPTNPFVLWGHNFTSVAGAAPIIGPAVAVFWGWGPALLWIVAGSVFFAGVHDMGAIWVSVRHKAESIGTSAERLMGRNGSLLFTVIVFLVLLMVNSVFAVAISSSFVGTPTSVVPAWGAIAVAVLIGQAVYRLRWNLLTVTIVGVIALYALILAGTRLPVVLPPSFLGMESGALWIILLFIYAGIASCLPVWALLQPRDYINGIQLFIGLGILYAGVFIGAPRLAAPAINSSVPPGSPSMIPLLFVTIACGAVSGFHAIVGSGTTSKQIDRETHIRPVGYGGAMGEGLLALGALLATSAGFAGRDAWHSAYASFGSGGLNGFIQAGALLIHRGIGLPMEFSVNLLAVLAILFAGTTMDTGVRLQRYIIQEWGKRLGSAALSSNIVATLTAIAACSLLAFGAGGASGSGGMRIWPLFGASNQLLASLTLLAVTLYLFHRKLSIWPTFIPMVFLFSMTSAALLIQAGAFLAQGNYFLFAMVLIVFGAAAWVVISAVSSVKHLRGAGLQGLDG